MRTPLVSAQALAAHPEWRCLDCRHDLKDPTAGERAFADGHLPGARFLHLDRDLAAPLTGRNGRHPLPDPERFAERLGALGISAETPVVAYDDHGGIYAARLWWMLRWIGHSAVAVLDGGASAWRANGGAVEQAVRDYPACSYRAQPDAACWVGAEHVLADFVHGAPATRGILLDARSADRYAGENETLDPVGGHIPGALNRFFGNNLDGETRCFRPAATLRAEFATLLGDCPPTAVIHQCGSGVTACHNLLAMEYAGLSGSRLYPGSWSEWCADPARPIAKGATP